ncbi:MAG TPA: carboxypeptidase-like regulatory domain-containing protein [Bacteroidales bacterium]|nr:carboxypeptidase-like regulatory domain-containing protein [Bacteroidales bacterium]HPT03703.1 carboxypeptidase-like regulatory domain-containing protein [Bacteroidales bacterium]
MKLSVKIIIGTAIVFFFSAKAFCQEVNTNLVQFSGIVVSSDGENLKPVPFTNIAVKNSHRGTTSDYYGYFSFVARKNEVVIFSSLGYKRASYTIPDTITSNRYSLIQIMTKDTIILAETVIYPWPTREQFKEAFVKLKIPDDDYDRAHKNLVLMDRKERGLAYEGSPYVMDGASNYQSYMSDQYNKLYYKGQVVPNNLLNPFAWADFFKAWKEGKFKSNQ